MVAPLRLASVPFLPDPCTSRPATPTARCSQALGAPSKLTGAPLQLASVPVLLDPCTSLPALPTAWQVLGGFCRHRRRSLLHRIIKRHSRPISLLGFCRPTRRLSLALLPVLSEARGPCFIREALDSSAHRPEVWWHLGPSFRKDLSQVSQSPAPKPPRTIGALIITYTILGIPTVIIVYYNPKPYSNY